MGYIGDFVYRDQDGSLRANQMKISMISELDEIQYKDSTIYIINRNIMHRYRINGYEYDEEALSCKYCGLKSTNTLFPGLCSTFPCDSHILVSGSLEPINKSLCESDEKINILTASGRICESICPYYDDCGKGDMIHYTEMSECCMLVHLFNKSKTLQRNTDI